MNKRERDKFKKELIVLRARISGDMRQLEELTLHESSGNAGSDFSSLAEVGTDNFDRETALRVASNEADTLYEIDEALLRIDNGGYGDCEGCKTKIPKKRLEVAPWARYCITCQETIERDGYLE